MNRLWNPISLALVVLALPWCAVPAVAQQPAKTVVPFKATWTVKGQSIPIPVDPMVISQPGTLTGHSDLLGAFTGVALATLHMGADGTPLFVTGVLELTMANGDALSAEVTGLFAPDAAPGSSDAALLITNGKGRFLGATGSGFIKGVVQMDPVTGQLVVNASIAGLITPPKP